MLKTRTSAILSMALVFVSGALLGGLAYRAYNTSTSSATTQRRPSQAEFRQRYISDMTARVKLDNQQVAELVKILDSSDEDLRPIIAQRRAEDQARFEKRRAENMEFQKSLNAKIDAMLRPDQRPAFQQWRDERQKERERHQRENAKRGGGPGGPPMPPPPDKK